MPGCLVAASNDKTLRSFEDSQETKVVSTAEQINCLENVNGVLFTGGRDGVVQEWNGLQVKQSMEAFSCVNALSCMSHQFASAHADNSIKLWT